MHFGFPSFPATFEYMKKSVERTSRWAERCLKAHERPQDQGLFGIVQGGEYEELRRQSAKDLVSMHFGFPSLFLVIRIIYLHLSDYGSERLPLQYDGSHLN